MSLICFILIWMMTWSLPGQARVYRCAFTWWWRLCALGQGWRQRQQALRQMLGGQRVERCGSGRERRPPPDSSGWGWTEGMRMTMTPELKAPTCWETWSMEAWRDLKPKHMVLNTDDINITSNFTWSSCEDLTFRKMSLCLCDNSCHMINYQHLFTTYELFSPTTVVFHVDSLIHISKNIHKKFNTIIPNYKNILQTKI